MPELHFKQLRYNYSACGPFSKHRERIKKFRETSSLKHLYRIELDKGCFDHQAALSDKKYLTNTTISDEILKDRAYEIDRNRGYDGYQRVLASIVYNCFDKKTGSIVSVNEQLAEELRKPVIKKSKRWKVYARFKENIQAADLAEMFSLNMHG